LSTKDGLISLTDLWKAAGSKPGKRATEWARNESTTDFIEEISRVTRSAKSHLIQTVRGKGKAQGTYAHWQIALAYAKYLSPELHIVVPPLQFLVFDAGGKGRGLPVDHVGSTHT